MFRTISSPNWTFVLILYTALFLEAHGDSDACTICSCGQDGYVDCANRNLTSVPLNIPPNTTRLSLSGNSIMNIAKEAFISLQILQELELQGNRIKSYDDGAFLFLPSIASIDLRDNKDMMCGCHLPALVTYRENNYNTTLDVKGECQTDLGQKIPILNYSQCTDYSLFQRNLQCQACPGKVCTSSKLTTCPGEEPVCRVNLSMKDDALNFEVSCSTYKECVEAIRSNTGTCNKWTNGISCTGCCVGNSCNYDDFIGWTKYFEFQLALKNSKKFTTSKELMPLAIEYELTHLKGIFKVEECGVDSNWTIFTIHCRSLKGTTEDDLRHSIKELFRASLVMFLMGYQEQNAELLHGNFCNENSTSNNGTLHWPVTKVGTNVTITCHAYLATRYCSPRTMNHLEMASSKSMTSPKCSPFTGIWQEPDMSECYNTEWITQRLQDITKREFDQWMIDDISKEVLNVSQRSVYFEKQHVDLVVDILERMVPFMSNVSVNTTVNNTLLIINNMINTPDKVLIETEKAKGSVSRMLDIIETIPETIPLEEQVTLSHSNLSIGVAKVNKDTFNGLFYGVSYGTNGIETKSVLYHQSYPDPQQANIQTFAFISIPKSLIKHLTDEETSALSKMSFYSFRNDKLYRVKQISSTGANTKIYSYVLAANVPDVSVRNLDEPVDISFSLKSKNDANVKCVYWEETVGKNFHWSTKGCKTAKNVPGRTVVCSCNRLTSFALLMDQTKENLILQIISNIGCVVSFVFLVLTIAIHVYFIDLWDLITSKILVNLCISLAVTNLIFIVGMQPYGETLAACKAVAALLHFFLLATFMWMAAEAIHVFISNFVAFKTYKASNMMIISIFAWGLPAVIVIITLVINYTDNYVRTREICWLSETFFYATFLAPAVIVLICNLTMFPLIIWLLRSKQNDLEYERRKERAFGIVGLFFFFGLPWVLAFFTVDEAAEALKYLFAIFCILQGTFIFIFHCIYKKDTRDIIMKYASRQKSLTFATGRSISLRKEGEDNTRETNPYEKLKNNECL